MSHKTSPNGNGNGLVVKGASAGRVVIPSPGAGRLTRLHYFDGKFLRAEDLQREQDYHRTLVALSNQGGGAGIVYGFDATLGGGDLLHLDPGLAIDPDGRVLHMPGTLDVGVGELIEASHSRIEAKMAAKGDDAFAECETAAVKPAATPVEGMRLYLIVVSYVEALCGEEDVYGRLCEDACATSADRPYEVEGVLIRAEPVTLDAPLPGSSAVTLGAQHLRSQIASAYFADEGARRASLISGTGLRTGVWCRGAAYDVTPEVAVALVARSGAQTVFLDAWTARRERIDVPPRRYWAWRMSMRPWEVYLAQILQFQCQLHELLGDGSTPGPIADPCAPHAGLMEEARKALSDVEGGRLGERLAAAIASMRKPASDRMLIHGGIVELPPAGYLPVDPVSTEPLPDQVRSLIGAGVDLRFCAVRHDYVAHALEEAQHMDRISLLEGLDDPARKPRVDVLVPDGELAAAQRVGIPLRAQIAMMPTRLPGLSLKDREDEGSDTAGDGEAVGDGDSVNLRFGKRPNLESDLGLTFTGAAHADATDGGGGSFCFAGLVQPPEKLAVGPVMKQVADLGNLGKLDQLRGLLGHAEDLPEGETGAVPAPDDVDAARAKAKIFLARKRGAGRPGEFSTGHGAGARQIVVWLDASCDRNPFDVAEGDDTAVKLDVRFAVPFGGKGLESLLRIVMDTSLTVEQASRSDSTTRLAGQATLYRGNHFDPEGGHEHGVEAEVVLTLDAMSGRTQLVLQIAGGGAYDLTVQARWEGRPLVLGFKATAGGLEMEKVMKLDMVKVLSGELEEDQAVLDPSDESHVLAAAAIDVVAATYEDQSFAAEATARLFPEGRSTGAIRGPRDWVLFHRRRDVDCTGAPPAKQPPQPPKTVAYELFQVRVENPAEGSRLCKLSRSGSMGAFVKLGGDASIGQVEFVAGQGALVTPWTEIKKLLGEATGGNQLGCLRMAAADPADAALGDARLAALEHAILLPRSSSYMKPFNLDAVPQPFAGDGVKRAVFMITVDPDLDVVK